MAKQESEFIALEIKSREDYDLANVIWPNLKNELQFKDVESHFLVLDLAQNESHMLVPAATFHEHFDHIEPYRSIRFLRFIKKD